MSTTKIITIDGREIPYQDGDTIIRAAHRAGIDIPHYCWHPGLSVAANCRMCLVELPPPAGRPAMMLDVLEWDEEKKAYVTTRKPKLQPSCQVPCAPGMEVKSSTSEHVARARSAVQELLLLNHPVDCPICDQAGECRLQDYWLEHQRSGKRMKQEPVHKPKGVVFGPTIVYDAERCIVCTRCVRFCEEVAKDPVLDVRERGNLNEITVSPGRELDHDYTLMTEHVCPVGALTAIDFRFKARVWFLRSAQTVCQGCATGCSAFLDFDPRNNTAYRHRPRENAQINKFWMCDEGMLSYKRAHEDRLAGAAVGKGAQKKRVGVDDALAAAKKQLEGHDKRAERVAVVLSAQASNEDNFALVTLAKTFVGAGDFFVTGKAKGEGDSILRDADKNPNHAGVLEVAGTTPPRPLSALVKALDAGEYDWVLALGADVDVDPKTLEAALARAKATIVVAAHEGPLSRAATVALPACSWAEATGTFVNRQGITQKSERALMPHGDAQPGWLVVAKLARALGYAMDWKKLSDVHKAMAPEPRSAGEGAAAAPAEAQV